MSHNLIFSHLPRSSLSRPCASSWTAPSEDPAERHNGDKGNIFVSDTIFVLYDQIRAHDLIIHVCGRSPEEETWKRNNSRLSCSRRPCQIITITSCLTKTKFIRTDSIYCFELPEFPFFSNRLNYDGTHPTVEGLDKPLKIHIFSSQFRRIRLQTFT